MFDVVHPKGDPYHCGVRKVKLCNDSLCTFPTDDLKPNFPPAGFSIKADNLTNSLNVSITVPYNEITYYFWVQVTTLG